MPMEEGYGKPEGNSLKDNPKLLDELRKKAHKGLEGIPEVPR